MKEPYKNVVLKVLLLLGYCFLFSVQLCFRYSSQSLDLDAYSSTAFVHAKGVRAPTVHVHASTSHAHHILNKRFEPVVELAMPPQEIGVAPVYSTVTQAFPLTREPIFARAIGIVPLRGPPAEA
jgi:hypothetical protein